MVIVQLPRSVALERGIARYFTGKPCNNGHTDERSAKYMHCLSCARESTKRQRLEDPARYKERRDAWAARNRPKVLGYYKKHHAKNKEKRNQYCKQWEARNAERRKAYLQNTKERKRAVSKLWAEKNRLAIKERLRQHAQNNKQYYALKRAKRRALLRQATPAWADKNAILFFYENCPAGYEVDHIVPLNGKTVCGLNVETNLQWLPAVANRQKSNRWAA